MACACSIDLTITNLVFLGVLVFAIKKLIKFVKSWRLEKMLEKYDSSPRDKVILHTLRRCKEMPSISPFALKLETYLRMAKIPYELETKDMMGPKGKLPWITYNGQHLGDSHLIIQFLNKKLSVDLNKNVTGEQLAVAKACRLVLENHFFWGGVHYRFLENSSSLSQLVKVPTLLKLLLPLRVCAMRKKMEDQGMGKHTPTEIYQMTEDDLHAISTILGKKKFFGGDEPCEEDSAMFGMLAQVVWGMPGSSYERLAHNDLINLKEYCIRMKELYWQDWESCVDKS